VHIRRNFGRSKQGRSSKTPLSSCIGIMMTIIGTICGKGVIDLTLRKSKAAQKEAAGSKKRKREDGEEENVDVNARVGTRNGHSLE
ncbi:hypothetical protein BCV72DRAFT_207364, partial [Rhizopus microsporus var. microsporus]